MDTPTIEELRDEARQLIDDNPDGLTGDQLDRFEDLEREIRRADALERIDAGHVGREAGFDAPNVQTRRDPFDQPNRHEAAAEVRSRALTAVEQWPADDTLKQSATATIERAGRDAADGGQADVRGISAHVLRYSHPLYVSAFRKFSRDPETYVADLTSDEARVWREAREYQRATLTTSGAVLPSPLDPTIVLTNDGVTDPMRQVARVDSTTAASKRYITSAGSTFSFDAEAAEVSDDTFTETEVEITTHKAQGFIEASIEAAMDQPGFESEVARIIADGKQRLEGSKFIKGAGDGSDEPQGIETALDGTSSEVAPETAETYAVDDVYNLIEELPPRFRNRATWQLEYATSNATARFESDTEPALFDGGQLLRRPFVLNSSVDSSADIDVSASEDNFILFVGDWRNYVILDRVGLSVHYVPPGVLQGSNSRPDGRVGWYAYWRVGAEPLTTSAFRALSIPTTA